MNMEDRSEFLGSGKCWHVLGSNRKNVPSLRFDVNIRRFWSMAASSEIAQAEGQVAILALPNPIGILLAGDSGLDFSFEGRH